jgi:ArsR family transcriptional regulator
MPVHPAFIRRDHASGVRWDVTEPEDVNGVVSLFKALADPVRVKLLVLVRRAPAGEVCFCDLAAEFDMPQSSLSHHLKIMVAAGVLARERRGTWSWYRVQSEALETLELLLRPDGPLRAAPHGQGPGPGRCG